MRKQPITSQICDVTCHSVRVHHMLLYINVLIDVLLKVLTICLHSSREVYFALRATVVSLRLKLRFQSYHIEHREKRYTRQAQLVRLLLMSGYSGWNARWCARRRFPLPSAFVLWITVVSFCASSSRSASPPGTVRAFQKISSLQGGFTGPLFNETQFGRSATSLGDLDGDGVGDVAVGSSKDNDAGTGSFAGNHLGAVYILFLNRDGTVKAEQKISDTEGNFRGFLKIGDNFGTSLSNLGDLDGDNITDIAVGAIGDDNGPDFRNRGAVWILFLNKNGTVKHSRR